MTTINKRYDFVFLFDVLDGNPNGDPDAGNLPRIDAETGKGLVTDVCLKRKIRNYVLLKHTDVAPYRIFIKEKAILNNMLLEAYEDLDIDLNKDDNEGKKRNKANTAQGMEIDQGRMYMCDNYYDIRAFGAVMSTGPNAGQVRGPVQMTFARSVDPVVTLEHTITRMAVTTEAEAIKQSGDNRTMGRKFTIPYGLYKAHGFISAPLAQQTGFNEEDLGLFWEALENMFEHDRSAARGLMSIRKIFIFEHEDKMGNAPAQKLFELIKVRSLAEDGRPIRSFDDYEVTIDFENLPEKVKIVERA